MKSKKIKRYSSILMDTHVKSKLLWVYFILIVLPMSYFTMFTSTRVGNVVLEQTLTAAQKNFEDIYTSTERTMSELDSVLEILTQDKLVYQISSHNPMDYPVIQQYINTQQISTSFSNLKKISSADNIRVYVDNDFIYSQENYCIFPLDSIRDSNWFKALINSNQNSMWLSPDDFADQSDYEQQWFSSIRIIYNPDSVLEPLAILRVDIHKDSLNEVFHATPVTEHGNVVLLKGDIPLLYNGEDVFEIAAHEQFLQFSNLEHDKWDTVNLQGGKSYVRTREITPSGWDIATAIPFDDVFKISHLLRSEMLFTMLAVGILAYILAYAISNSSILRITKLAQTMRLVKNGDLTVRIKPKGGDEIGQLMNGFNQMMGKINTLLEEKYEYGQQIKGLELKALQAQINPHFLYNSLDLINCMAIQNEIPEITAMVNSLAKFYKLSLSRGRDVISLRDELMHSRLYIQIQNMRFDNRIQTQWEIDEALLDFEVIKIILQPIIENAIIHGIFERQDGVGALLISCAREGDDIFIRVSDNGVGMDEETILLNFTPGPPGSVTDTSSGYGVRNIQDRLKMAYGEPYGLSCQSTLGTGTVVTVRIHAVVLEHKIEKEK